MSPRFLAPTFFLVLCASACADEAPAQAVSPAAFAGTWTFDAARSGGAGADTGAPAAKPSPGSGVQHHGNGSHSPGGMGSGMSGGHGGGGGQHRHDHGGAPAASTAHADDSLQNDRGLERTYADHIAISTLAKPARIRFDDGSTLVELGLDGMNVSGPGVGGTLALSSTSPDLVIDTVTDSGYSLSERYHLIDERHLELHIRMKKPGADSATDSVRMFDRTDAGVAPVG